MPNTTAARTEAIISMVLALRGIETPNDPDDAGLTRRYTHEDYSYAPQLPRPGSRPHPCGEGVEHRA